MTLNPLLSDFRQKCVVVVVLFLANCLPNLSTRAQQPAWIWSPTMDPVTVGDSRGDCYYRKKFTLIRPEKAELEVLAGDEYEIYINGQLAGRGQSFGAPKNVSVAALLKPGVNSIAAKVHHDSSAQIGLSAKLRIKEKGETKWRVLVTDSSWKTYINLVDGWQKGSLNDLSWLNAVAVEPSSNPIATTAPIDGPSAVPTNSASTISAQSPAESKTTSAATAPQTAQSVGDRRFAIDPEFTVQEVLSPSETGSLIALEFNEFGDLLLSREGGPLLIADPSKPVGHPDRVRVYCQEVNSCQGILPLNGSVYVTGQGPDGLGLYLLADTNHDGTIESTKRILSFTGELGEHGPHGIQLGPDGMLYVILGNGTQLNEPVAETSPYKHWYEGDLVPRYEDPGGHAVGVKAPGGTIIRLTIDGSKIERFAGGIRNAYDLVFDENGELFIHDSDMESDEGTTWYRPTNVYHVPAGAEIGWRSGWSNFPNHFVDQTPAICETGRGSPTGAVLYQHLQFPVRYLETLFLADWSEGRILALRKQLDGAGYVAKAEIFLSGKPLNVCDLTIAEDGGMYFCTGGRGTSGGVYRVVWNGVVPDNMLEYESDLARVIRHPQPSSAWARQSIAELKNALGDQWGPGLEGVAIETRNPSKFRLRAMQLLVLYGPAPSDEFLEKLATDSAPEIRAEAARLYGIKGGPNAETQLAVLITDKSPLVRRRTCESYLRLGQQPEWTSLLPLLSSLDRIESGVARRLLECIPTDQWPAEILKSTDKRIFIQGAIALMTVDPTVERAYQVLAQSSNLMDGFVNDRDFADLIRVMQIALVQGKVDPQRVPGLTARIGNEFPCSNSIINQELARLMAYLKIGDLEGRIVEYLAAPNVPLQDRVHVAMNLQFVGAELSADSRLAVIDCLESARTADHVGGSYTLYLKRAVEDVSKTMTADQVNVILKNGSRWPNAVLAAFYKMPEQLSPETVQQVIALDQALQQNQDTASQQLRLGVIAILARNNGNASMEYLRQLWQREEKRRDDIVIGLAQQPGGDNWPYLVNSLPILDDLTGREIIQKLYSVPRRPREPQHYRDVIELGYRLRNAGALDAVKLLEFWSQESPVYVNDNWQSRLDNWSQWFQQKWPDQAEINLRKLQESSKYSVNELLSQLEKSGLGDRERGKHLFNSTQCATCHQLGSVGQTVGPDLNNLSQRFSVREVLEATLEPSHTISDRYQSKVIVTVDGDQFNGMAIKQADGGYVILRSDGKRIRVAADDIEEIKDSKISAMPTGLLNELAPSEIADLVAYLMQPKNEMAQQDNSFESR